MILVGIFVVIAIIFGVWAKQQKTLAQIMNTEDFGEMIYLDYKAMQNGEWNFRSGEVTEKEDIARIAEILADTEISFAKLESFGKKNIGEGNVWYEVDDLSQGKWIQIMDDGEVHTGFVLPDIYQIDMVYRISEENRTKCVTALDEILQKYEKETEETAE